MTPLLTRHGQTRQVGATRAQRLQQVTGSYQLRNQVDVQGARILLVDDLVTTGATLGEAAKILREAGAKTVDAIVVAQKQ
jgi:predicted amidophosphoribosyltransferase